MMAVSPGSVAGWWLSQTRIRAGRTAARIIAEIAAGAVAAGKTASRDLLCIADRRPR